MLKNDELAIGVSGSADPFPSVWYDLSCETHFWMKWRFRVWLNAMKKREIDLKKNKRVLDVGCGSGTFSRQIESVTAWVVDGLDPNRKAIEMNKRGRGSLTVGSLFTISPSVLQSYDHLFFFDVLEHLSQPKDDICAAARVLKPSGLLHVNVPALPFLYSAYDKIQGHQLRFTPEHVHSLFQGTPFRVIDVRYWGLSLVPFALVRKWFVSGISDESKIMINGFSFGGRFFNRVLTLPMLLETTMCRKTFIGTSLMVLAENVG